MNTGTVFVPVSQEELAGLIAGENISGKHTGFAATSALMSALEYTLSMKEESAWAAMVLAFVWSATQNKRFLAVLENISVNRSGMDEHNGAVIVDGVTAKNFTCWFSISPKEKTTELIQICQGLSLDEAWERSEVQVLLKQIDYLWHGPKEAVGVEAFS